MFTVGICFNSFLMVQDEYLPDENLQKRQLAGNSAEPTNNESWQDIH